MNRETLSSIHFCPDFNHQKHGENGRQFAADRWNVEEDWSGVIIECGARVISQWETGGSVFKHALMQIPTIYGSRYQCYEA